MRQFLRSISKRQPRKRCRSMLAPRTRIAIVASLIVLLVAGAAAFFVWRQGRSVPVPQTGELSERQLHTLAGQLGVLEAKEKRVTQTTWKKEILAEECGQVFERLWDAINGATNKLSAVSAFSFGQLVLPALAPARK